jgi:imidazole glycerol-phosphate synthase subunit HisH
MIVIIDYGMGNLRSVQKKIERIGFNAVITDDKKIIEQAQKIILPGVGHFANGVKNIKERGIWTILNEKVLNDNTPILGICLGMQLMAKFSEEGNEVGFGWFDAKVVRFRVSNNIKFKIPHIGWNSLNINRKVPFLNDINNESQFYFVHSYHVICNNKEDELTSTEYDYHFTSSIAKNNIIGVQFHPEKSHDQGEVLLKNFLTKY